MIQRTPPCSHYTYGRHWQQSHLIPQRNRLPQQHPVLVPLGFFAGALLLLVLSFFASYFFPLLALTGIAPGTLCFFLAIVSGIAGILTSIIGVIERFDRSRLPAPKYAQVKEETLL